MIDANHSNNNCSCILLIKRIHEEIRKPDDSMLEHFIFVKMKQRFVRFPALHVIESDKINHHVDAN